MSAMQQEAVTVGEVVPMRRSGGGRAMTKKVSNAKTGATSKARRRSTVKLMPTLHKAERRTIGQVIAALAASFLPLASYDLSHRQVTGQPMMWVLVAAALLFSAPTLAEWAARWCKSPSKAWGFTILLEGVMVFGSSEYLSLAGLAILMSINCNSAWQLAGRRDKEDGQLSG